MALIKCPECGNEISNKSLACIHCGFPLTQLKKSNISIINGKEHNLSCILDLINSGITDVEVIQRKIQSTIADPNLSLSEYYQLAHIIIKSNAIPEVFNHTPTMPTVPHCPKCGSTAITTGARGVNWTMGLIGASKTVNRCGSCGHTWKP